LTGKQEIEVAKPPQAKPHSDMDGVHQDERRNTDVAAELDQGAADLAEAKAESVGRPPSGDDLKSRDDRE
jgi:hypothetical protein